MNKKGQITIFIIIGIILLVLVALVLYLSRESARIPAAEKIPIEAQPLKNYIDNCLTLTAIDAVKLAGMQGGYTDTPNLYLDADYSKVAYYYNKGDDNSPSRLTIESQISSFIEATLDICIGNLSAFPQFNIVRGNASAVTTIGENKVDISLDYPVNLISGDSKIEIRKYNANVPVRLGHIYDIARAINNHTMTDPEWIDMSYISGFDVEVDMVPYGNEDLVYSITDTESSLNGEPYVFLFADKFVLNQAPSLNINDSLTFIAGNPVIFKVNATDPEENPLTFSDDTAMFDITEQGVILFTPQVSGEFDVTLSVEDNHLNKVSKKVKFRIK